MRTTGDTIIELLANLLTVGSILYLIYSFSHGAPIYFRLDGVVRTFQFGDGK